MGDKVWFSTGNYTQFKELLREYGEVWSDDMEGGSACFTLENNRIMRDTGSGPRPIDTIQLGAQYGISGGYGY